MEKKKEKRVLTFTRDRGRLCTGRYRNAALERRVARFDTCFRNYLLAGSRAFIAMQNPIRRFPLWKAEQGKGTFRQSEVSGKVHEHGTRRAGGLQTEMEGTLPQISRKPPSDLGGFL